MTISINQACKLLSHSKPLCIQNGRLSKASCFQRLRRINPSYANKQDRAVAEFFCRALSNDPDTVMTKSARLFQDKILKHRLFKSVSLKNAANQLSFHLKVQLLASSLNLPSSILSSDPDFVNFAIRNHFHHRIDLHYQKYDLGIRCNNGDFLLPLKRDEGVVWQSWKSFPLNRKGQIDGLDLLAYGWEEHDNSKWREFKPFKVLSHDEFLNKFPRLTPSLDNPSVELVTTLPRGKSPGRFGHIYINYYVPNKDHVLFYSIEYDLEDIRFPDVMEFLECQHISTLRTISPEKWEEAKSFIETIQEIHRQKTLHRCYKHPDKQAMRFYKLHMRKNCGNFAVALFEKSTGIKNLYALSPVMSVFFPKPFHKIADWVEERLPRFLQRLILKINIVVRGVLPWRLAPKQRALEET